MSRGTNALDSGTSGGRRLMRYGESSFVNVDRAYGDSVVRAEVQRFGRTAPEGERLAIRKPNRQIFIPVEEIEWIESDRNNVLLHLAGRTITFRETLSDLMTKLPGRRFVRVQRGAIVNVEHVEEIRRAGRDYEVVLRDGDRVLVGKAYFDDLDEAMTALWQ